MNPNEQVSLLVLFPRKEDLSVERFLVSLGYRPTLIRLESDDYDIDLAGAHDALVLRIPTDPSSYLSGLANESQQRLLTPRLVLNHARNDVLAPRVKGAGTEWQVSTSTEAEIKTQTVEWILDSLLSPERSIWVNVYTGRHGTTKQSFCPGRYSLAGFEHALRTSPRLKEMIVLNVCLTYFSGGGNGGCRDCLTTRYLEEIKRHGDGVTGLLQFIDELVRGSSEIDREQDNH